MNRLFISTKESWIPNETVHNANYIEEKGLRVFVYDEVKNIGWISVSTKEEAQWFVKMIFFLSNNPEPLVVDFESRSFYAIPADEFKQKNITKENRNKIVSAIQQIQLE